MKHLDFVAWMVLFPVAMTVCDVLIWQFGERHIYSEGVKEGAAMLKLGLWFGIGWLLY